MFVSFLKKCRMNLTVKVKQGDSKEVRKGKTKLKNCWSLCSMTYLSVSFSTSS